MVAAAHRHARRVLRRGDGWHAGWTTQEEWKMNDRELLELAAKAAGRKILQDPHGRFRDCTGAHHSAMNIFSFPLWNPLTDDGDALRLAVKLRMTRIGEVWVIERTSIAEWERDPQAATRRAITRAAAEIGKGMK
jgi:hypothetical protein